MSDTIVLLVRHSTGLPNVILVRGQDEADKTAGRLRTETGIVDVTVQPVDMVMDYR